MSASTNLLELPSTQDSLSQFITNLGNSANVLAEVLTRQAHSISQTGRVDEALMVSLVCLQNLLGQFQYLVASGQEAVVQKQSFKLEIEQVTKKIEQIQEMLGQPQNSQNMTEQITKHVTKQLEQISKKMEETAKDEIKKVSEQSKNQIEVLSKKMTEQSKGEIMKMGENTSKTINKYTENMSDQICNLDYTADTIQDDLRAIKEAIDDSKEYHKEAVAHANTAKEAAVLTINELQLAAEDLKRERLLFQDQHDRLENKINQMQRVLEGKEEEVKGLKAIYSKLSSCSTRLVQSAGAFREVQYKFLVDAAAKLDQKMARIAHHVAYTSPMAGKKAPAAAPTNGTPKADRVVQEGDSDVEPEDKVAELKRMVAELKYTNDVLTNKNALLELRVAKFEHEQRQQQQGALAPQPSAAPAVPPPPPPQLGPGEVPETPCQTLRSVRSRRSLRAAESVGESLAGLTLSEPNDSDKTTIVRPVVSVGSLVQPDLWERLLAPALLSDEIKRRIRLVKPQVAGGLRMEDVFLRVVNIAVHDECWNEFDQYLKHGGDDWHCVKRMVNNGWTTSRILPGNNCEHGKECLWVKRTSVDYGKVIFKPNAM